jgi:hypothetical protein
MFPVGNMWFFYLLLLTCLMLDSHATKIAE